MVTLKRRKMTPTAKQTTLTSIRATQNKRRIIQTTMMMTIKRWTIQMNDSDENQDIERPYLSCPSSSARKQADSNDTAGIAPDSQMNSASASPYACSQIGDSKDPFVGTLTNSHSLDCMSGSNPSSPQSATQSQTSRSPLWHLPSTRSSLLASPSLSSHSTTLLGPATSSTKTSSLGRLSNLFSPGINMAGLRPRRNSTSAKGSSTRKGKMNRSSKSFMPVFPSACDLLLRSLLNDHACVSRSFPSGNISRKWSA